MTCAAWEERVALAAGGEIEQREVAEHLSACADCRALFADLVALRGELAGFGEPSGSDVAALHAAVMRRVSRRRTIPWLRSAAAAAVAAAVLGWTALRPTPIAAPSAPSAPAVVPHVVAHASGVQGRSPDRPVRKIRTTAPVRPAPPAMQEPTIIHMQTEDPDVLIIWIAE